MLLDAQILMECNKMKENTREFKKLPSGAFFIAGKAKDENLIKMLKEIVKELKDVNE